MTTIRLAGFLTLLAAVVLVGCDSPDDPSSDCSTRPIAKELQRVLFWGEASPGNWVPNGGKYQVGDVWWPDWYADDRILIYTLRRENGVTTRGIFEVSIDPQTYRFVAVQSFGFSIPIRDFDYDPVTERFLISYVSGGDNHLVRAFAQGSSLVVADTVLSAEWSPENARYARDGGGVISYARDPATLISGFYYISNEAQVLDSLVFAIQFDYLSDAHGFDVNGGKLCFGETNPVDYKSEIRLIDLNSDRTPRTIASFEGAFVSTRVNRDGTCAVVCQEDLRVPGSVVRVLNLVTGQPMELDCQIHPCFFPIANFGTWNPRGDAFAFSAAGFNGESGRIPSQLWIRKQVACP